MLKSSLWALLVRFTIVLLRNRIIFGENQIFLPFSAQFRQKKKRSFLQHAVWRRRLITKVNLKLIKRKQKKAPSEKTSFYTEKRNFRHFFLQNFLQNIFTSSKTNLSSTESLWQIFSEISKRMHFQNNLKHAILSSKLNWEKEKWQGQTYAPNNWSD